MTAPSAGKAGTQLTPARLQSLSRALTPQAAYLSGGKELMHGWAPAARRANDDIRVAGRQAMAYAIESLQNSGYLAGGVEVITALMVGDGLKLSASPNVQQLKWDEQTINAWTRDVEARFKAYANTPIECDAAGRQTLGQMCFNQVKAWFPHGEHLSTVEVVERPGTMSRVRMLAHDPYSLPRDQWRHHADQSIETDDYGFPLRYRFKLKPLDNPLGAERDVLIEAKTVTGRAMVVHVFDPAAGARRGITCFAPVLRRLRAFDQLSDATLVTALIQTIFAASIESDQPAEMAFQALQTIDEQGDVDKTDFAQWQSFRGAWYENSALDLGEFGKLVSLLSGEKLNFHRAETPNSNYEPFTNTLLREIARCVPCTFETLTGDYTKATYSSVRIATAEHWPIIMYRRKHIAAPFMQAAYEAWLEEQVLTGALGFPGGPQAFLANRTAACQAQWRGPARPTADDLKTTNAQVAKIEAGLSTFEAECAENGLDAEEVMYRRAVERARMREIEAKVSGQAPPVAPTAADLVERRKALKDADADG